MLTDGGIISSPNFPGSYYGYVECQWVLTAAMPPYGVSIVSKTVDESCEVLGRDLFNKIKTDFSDLMGQI